MKVCNTCIKSRKNFIRAICSQFFCRQLDWKKKRLSFSQQGFVISTVNLLSQLKIPQNRTGHYKMIELECALQHVNVSVDLAPLPYPQRATDGAPSCDPSIWSKWHPAWKKLTGMMQNRSEESWQSRLNTWISTISRIKI